MDTTPKELTPEEEVKAQEAPKEEDIRENIIDEYGFDEIDDADKIDKLVSDKVDSAKKLSAAIGQKIKAREKAAELETKLESATPKEEKPVAPATDDLDEKLDKKLNEKLEKQVLDDLEYPDELTEEISTLAKLKNVSVKQVLRDPYIVNRVEAYEKEQKTEEATISRTNKKGSSKTYTFETPPDVDMNTEEGRKEWDSYKKAMTEQGK